MKLYAELPRRRYTQIAMDVAMAAWTWWWASVGMDIAHRFAEGGRATGGNLEKAGQDIATKVNDTAQAAAGVPFVGETLATKLRDLASVGPTVETMGTSTRGDIIQLGQLLGTIVALVPIFVVAVFWLRGRLKYVFQTTRAVPRDRTTPAAIERLALMALVHRDAAKVTATHPDAMKAWREGDMTVMRDLAELELAERGLRMPDSRRRRRPARIAGVGTDGDLLVEPAAPARAVEDEPVQVDSPADEAATPGSVDPHAGTATEVDDEEPDEIVGGADDIAPSSRDRR